MKLLIIVDENEVLYPIVEGVYKYEVGNFVHFSLDGNLDFKNKQPSITEFAKRNNGITIEKYEDGIKIFNDPFRSIPIFISEVEKNKTVLFTDYEIFFKYESSVGKIDIIGVWESILYGEPLHTRTIFNNIEQMIASSVVDINLREKKYEITRYWNYDIKEKNIEFQESLEILDKKLNEIFSRFSEMKCVMGVSGGLDSRLSLYYLSSLIDSENIEAFTFGYNEKIMEYEYAKKVTEKLNISKPYFHKLEEKNYLDTLDDIVLKAGGLIGVTHIHSLDYIKNNMSMDKTYISNYYTDALFGYNAVQKKYNENYIDTSYYKIVSENEFDIPQVIVDEIIKDIKYICSMYEEKSNFSCIEEFLYVTEKNPKFHIFLSHIYSTYVNCSSPFLNYDLLTYMISLPIEYRIGKKIERELLKNKKIIIDDISSNKYSGKSGVINTWGRNWISSRVNYLLFRSRTMINGVLRIITDGRVQLLNKYSTENYHCYLYGSFRKYLIEACDYFGKIGLTSEFQNSQFIKIPRRFKNVNVRYQVITLWSLISKYGGIE